jgi:signal transduction histidine kinase
LGALTSPQDHDASLLREGGLAAVVIRNKERILERFCHRAQQTLKGARREPLPVLVDTLPSFITRVALALAGSDYMEFATQYSNIALQHGNERARFTSYSLTELLKEYQFFREILVNVLEAEAQPGTDEWKIVHRSVDEAMAEAATAFVQVQDDFRELFTAALTHDFRGPLSSAWNFLELMRRDEDPAQREQFARRAAQNLRRIGRMIASLLDASRSNAGERLDLDARQSDVGALLDEAIGDLEPQARQRVVLDLPTPLVAFWDREKIRRAIDNLMDNAIKYSPDGSRVTIRAIDTHGRIQISVHNFGDPIPEADRLLLFQPYRRTAAAQRSGKVGWGLGLVQVQAIAEAHGGSVGVESAADAGTTFTIDLLRDVRTLHQAGSGPEDQNGEQAR